MDSKDWQVNSMNGILTQQQYVSYKGMYCPYCQSDDLRGGEMVVDTYEIILHVTCEGCGERWNDVYELTGYKRG